MNNLAELTESLKRSVAVPGTFADVFPDTSDDDLGFVLADAYSEARLDGFLSGTTIDLESLAVSPALEPSHGALIVIYAGYQILASEIRNRNTRVMYQAGAVQYETEQTASMLNELLRQLHERKKSLITRAEQGELDDSGVAMFDLAYMKATGDYGWNSGLSLYEYR